MGLKNAKALLIDHLKKGAVQHEARNEIDEKNLLHSGEVTLEQVQKMINATKGDQYLSIPHKDAPSVEVHVFTPEVALEVNGEKEKWYIKAYVIEPDAFFISVHKST